MTDESTATSERRVPRRTVLLAAGAVGAAGVLAACGQSGSADPASPSPDDGAPSSGPGGAAVLVTAASVPVGGGVVLADERLVVTQPAAGEFHAFSSICTHEGTTLNQVTGTEIICPRHGSRFSTQTGDVVRGPATVPLAETEVKVKAGNVVVA